MQTAAAACCQGWHRCVSQRLFQGWSWHGSSLWGLIQCLRQAGLRCLARLVRRHLAALLRVACWRPHQRLRLLAHRHCRLPVQQLTAQRQELECAASARMQAQGVQNKHVSAVDSSMM